nr:penicillin-binding protein 1C [Jannaschia pohangensis]
MVAIGAGWRAFDDWVDRTAVPPLTVATSAEVLDREGALLRAYTVADGRWRMAVGAGEVDLLYVAMLIAWEDRRFRDHAGVDPRAVVRAAVQGVRHGTVVSGASTLTMQVARLIEDGPTGSWYGKLRQARLALALERLLTKDEVLAMYLARAPFGGNLEGVRAASLAYFGKEPARLTPAQAALLVALPQSPETRRPDRAPDVARAARDRVLWRMADLGLIDGEARDAALAEAVPARRRDFPARAPHLADRLSAGGRVATTLDGALQARLERLATEAVAGQGRRLGIAILVADHHSGEILASVGSADYDNDARAGFVDMTQALRSPGSTLKPLVYALAFDLGMAHPETLIDDVPTTFGTWVPQNFDGTFQGTMRARAALQLSRNIPAVKLAEGVGPARVMSAIRRSGARAELPGGPPGLAVTLGGVGMNLEGLVQLYATLARGGGRVTLSALPGQGGPEAGRITGAAAAWQVGDVLADLVPPSGAEPGDVAWKTGTSYGHRDAWAIGWDGAHVVGVWMGRPDGTPVPGAFGGDLAAPVMFRAFARIARDRVPLPPAPPETLTVTNAELPAPLQRFSVRGAGLLADADAPAIAFPPDGAVVVTGGQPLAAQVRDGRPPFTWLADGRPVAVNESGRATLVDVARNGFVTLTVIDAAGRSARTQVRVDGG